MISYRDLLGLAAGAVIVASAAQAPSPAHAASLPGNLVAQATPAPTGQATPAPSAEAPRDPQEPRAQLAVLEVRVSGTVEARRVEGLSNVLVAEASRVPGLEVITSADIRTMLGFEAERQLIQCDTDSSCLAELGGALGVGYLLVADVTRIGDVWLLTLNLLDMTTARAAKRSSRRVSEESALIDATSDALREVLTAIPGLELPSDTREVSGRGSRGASAEGSRGASAEGSRGTAPAGALDPSRGGSAGRGWLAWTGTAVGGAAAVTGVALYASALQTQAQWDEDRRLSRLTVSVDQARTAEVLAPVGLGLAIGGTALLVGSFFLPAPDERVAVFMMPGPQPYAAVAVRLP